MTDMTVMEMAGKAGLKVINEGSAAERQAGRPFCCDLLSIAMGKAPAGCSWVTVMANMNTLAVASLADAAAVILAEGVRFDENALDKAREQGITVLASELPVFDTALKIYELTV